LVSWSQMKKAINFAGSFALALADTWWTPFGAS
jgi:hypothetical protein